MQHKRRRREREQQEQVVRRQRLGLEDRLHERHIHQPELRQKRDRHRYQQHPVLRQPTAQSAVLDRRDEVEEDEAGERLRKAGYECCLTREAVRIAYHRLVAARHVVIIRERKVVDKKCACDDNKRGE